MIANERDRDRGDPQRSEPPDEGPTARRLLWAVAGAVAYTVVYVAAKYVFGF